MNRVFVIFGVLVVVGVGLLIWMLSQLMPTHTEDDL